MRKVEEIEKDIQKLEKELQDSKNFYQWEELIPMYSSNECIGLHKIGDTRIILEHLNKGCTLQYRHSAYGIVEVWMNPHRNRILCTENDKITEDNVTKFMLGAVGTWYLKV